MPKVKGTDCVAAQIFKATYGRILYLGWVIEQSFGDELSVLAAILDIGITPQWAP
jgi:hypothetical protein